MVKRFSGIVFTERFRSLFEPEESQETFGKRVGIARNTVAQYYNGYRLPDSSMLKQICERCNASSDWLLGLSNVRRINADVQAVAEYTGLSEDAIETLHTLKEDAEENNMEALSKALASKMLLENLCAIMAIESPERGFYEGACSPENGFYHVEMSPDSFATALGFRLLHTLEAVRTGNSAPLQSYPPYDRRLSETIEALRAEGRLIEKGDADNGKPTKSR